MKQYKLSFWFELKNRLRNQYYSLFRRRLLDEKLAKRKGECRQCGICCEVKIFGIRCPFFNKKTRKCWLYNTKFMPKSCKLFPFDLKNRYEGKIKEIEKNCGYYWE